MEVNDYGEWTLYYEGGIQRYVQGHVSIQKTLHISSELFWILNGKITYMWYWNYRSLDWIDYQYKNISDVLKNKNSYLYER